MAEALAARAQPLAPAPGAARGFTLIELLVAITILAVVAVLGWRGLDSIIRSRVALSADMEQTRGMQLAFAQLQSDCDHFVRSSDLGNRKTVVADAQRLILVRRVFADDQPTRLQVVAFRLKDGVLSRRESVATRDLSVLDTLWQAALADTDTAQMVVLQSGVAAMEILQWQSDGPGWRVVDTGSSEADPMTAGSSATTPAGAGLISLSGAIASLTSSTTSTTGATGTTPLLSAAAAFANPVGLKVSLQLRGLENGVVKVFLLGAV